MSDPRILSHHVVYEGKYEDSGVIRYRVKCDTRPAKRLLQDELGIYPYHCSCSHDCCGHVQYSSPVAIRRLRRKEWLVEQGWSRNV